MCIIVFDVYYRPGFSESLLWFGVSSSGEFRDCIRVAWLPALRQAPRAVHVPQRVGGAGLRTGRSLPRRVEPSSLMPLLGGTACLNAPCLMRPRLFSAALLV